MKRIQIKAGDVTVSAELNDSATSMAIWEALPMRSRVNTWGDEIYFTIPVAVDEENPKEVVELGDVAYWPPGKALCIFFGPTPVSRGSEIRPASAVNVVGRVFGDPAVLKRVPAGATVEIERM